MNLIIYAYFYSCSAILPYIYIYVFIHVFSYLIIDLCNLHVKCIYLFIYVYVCIDIDRDIYIYTHTSRRQLSDDDLLGILTDRFCQACARVLDPRARAGPLRGLGFSMVQLGFELWVLGNRV